MVYLRNIPLEALPSIHDKHDQSMDKTEDVIMQSQLENYYAQVIAMQTSGCSGADIANIVNESVLMATRRGAQRVAEQDILAGIQRTKNGIKRSRAIAGVSDNPILASFEQMISKNLDKMKQSQRAVEKVVRAQNRMP